MKLAAPRTSVTAHPGDGIKTLWPRRSSRRVGIRRLGLKPFLILFLIFRHNYYYITKFLTIMVVIISSYCSY